MENVKRIALLVDKATLEIIRKGLLEVPAKESFNLLVTINDGIENFDKIYEEAQNQGEPKVTIPNPVIGETNMSLAEPQQVEPSDY